STASRISSPAAAPRSNRESPEAMRTRQLEAAIAAARAGAEISRGYFGTGLDVERKSDRSPVTIADRESEERIVAVLRQAFPDYGILGEEFGERQGAG